MKFSASVIVLLAVLMSVASAGLMLFLNFDDLFKLAPVVKAEFTSVEFDADKLNAGKLRFYYRS